jgi:hypothetical protein
VLHFKCFELITKIVSADRESWCCKNCQPVNTDEDSLIRENVHLRKQLEIVQSLVNKPPLIAAH